MAIRTELVVRLPNSPGALADVCQRLGRERVRIFALCLDAVAGARLIVDNPLHAAATLREAHLAVAERDVLYTTVSSEPGALGRLLQRIAEAGVNLEYVYASALETDTLTGVVLGVEQVAEASARIGI